MVECRVKKETGREEEGGHRLVGVVEAAGEQGWLGSKNWR